MPGLLLWCRRLCLALVLSGACLAQPEPVDVGVLTRRVGETFQPLELVNAVRQSDIDLFSGMRAYFTIPGKRSKVRYKAGEPVEFYLRSFLDTSDPRAAMFPIRDPQRFALFPTEEDGDTRQVILRDDGIFTNTEYAGQPLVARLHGAASFLLAPSQPLTPGEYAIQYPLDAGSRLFCFGIDP